MTAVDTPPQPAPAGGHAQQVADVLVIFGITGDLAKVMTFHSLYRLERRGLLRCPIIGVAVSDWSADDLRAHARAAIEDCGEQVDDKVFDRFAARLSYVSGDFGDDCDLRAGEGRGGRAAHAGVLPGDPAIPVRAGDQGALRGGADRARVAWWSRSRSGTTSRRPRRWPTRSTSTSTSRSCTGSTTSSGRWASARSSICGSRTRCSSRSGTATTSPTSRSRWRRASGSTTAATSTTPSARSGMSSSTTSCRWWPPPPWSRPHRATRRAQERAVLGLPRDAGGGPRALRARTVRGLPAIDGVAADSTTETYAALKLEIDNWRWAGVPWFIRTGKCLPVTQTELRAVFRRPPRLGFAAWSRLPEPSQIIVKLDPTTGVRLLVEAQRHEAAEPEQISLDMEFAQEGGEGRRRTRCCCTPR